MSATLPDFGGATAVACGDLPDEGTAGTDTVEAGAAFTAACDPGGTPAGGNGMSTTDPARECGPAPFGPGGEGGKGGGSESTSDRILSMRLCRGAPAVGFDGVELLGPAHLPAIAASSPVLVTDTLDAVRLCDGVGSEPRDPAGDCVGGGGRSEREARILGLLDCHVGAGGNGGRDGPF